MTAFMLALLWFHGMTPSRGTAAYLRVPGLYGVDHFICQVGGGFYPRVLNPELWRPGVSHGSIGLCNASNKPFEKLNPVPITVGHRVRLPHIWFSSKHIPEFASARARRQGTGVPGLFSKAPTTKNNLVWGYV